MEEGLGDCTHFLVLLTPNSLGKPWVETEIDAGFVRAVEGKSRFIGVRVGVRVADLSPFLQTLRCPEVVLDDEEQVAELIADIHDVSRKPKRGAAPRYVKPVPEGLGGWSTSAVEVAKFLVGASDVGRPMDPMVNVATVVDATGLPTEDARLGLLDLEEAGLIERSRPFTSETFWPLVGLFVEFDRHFLDFNNVNDAAAVANRLISEELEGIEISDLADLFPDWPPRRLNSAVNYLDDGNIVDAIKALHTGPWAAVRLGVTDRTRRFAREHG